MSDDIFQYDLDFTAIFLQNRDHASAMEVWQMGMHRKKTHYRSIHKRYIEHVLKELGWVEISPKHFPKHIIDSYAGQIGNTLYEKAIGVKELDAKTYLRADLKTFQSICKLLRARYAPMTAATIMTMAGLNPRKYPYMMDEHINAAQHLMRRMGWQKVGESVFIGGHRFLVMGRKEQLDKQAERLSSRK